MNEMPAEQKRVDEKLRWSRGRLESVPACPACGSQERLGAPLSCRDHRIELPDIWTLHKCAGCGSLYLDPRPDAASLPRAYEIYDTHDKDDETPPDTGMAGILWGLIHGYLNHRFGMERRPASKWGVPFFAAFPPLRLKLDYYGRHLFAATFPQQGQLLDVGCGNGAFLVRAEEMGWNATGLEPDPEAVATCRQQGLEVVEGVLSTAPKEWRGYFDVLTMSHAIEHVPEPQADLKLAWTMLKPGGVLWIALPNPVSWGAKLFAESWRDLHPPYHLSIPSRNQLCSLLRKAGFVSISAHRIGARNARTFRESAQNARHAEKRGWRLKTGFSPLVRLVADASATFSPDGGEETVLTACRPARL